MNFQITMVCFITIGMICIIQTSKRQIEISKSVKREKNEEASYSRQPIKKIKETVPESDKRTNQISKPKPKSDKRIYQIEAATIKTAIHNNVKPKFVWHPTLKRMKSYDKIFIEKLDDNNSIIHYYKQKDDGELKPMFSVETQLEWCTDMNQKISWVLPKKPDEEKKPE